MFVYKTPHLFALSLVIAWLPLHADDQVTIYSPTEPSSPASSAQDPAHLTSPDGQTTVVNTSVPNSVVYSGSPAPSATLGVSTPTASFSAPEVETVLPIARHLSSSQVSIGGVNVTVGTGTSTAMLLPGSRPLITNNYGSPLMTSPVHYQPGQDPLLNGPSVHTPKRTYPWKDDIITTVFWIGEAGCSISSTDNVASAWDEDWRRSYRGSDSPTTRDDNNGLLPKNHAATCNPFYIALPFNDLAFPEKARQWLPTGWYIPPKYGQRPVSACKDRWVEIKFHGVSCFAQWEDVGPLTYDHAEYVFGPERPTTYTRAGLDVSPAVAAYLHMDTEHKNITSWRFVEAEDVPPGQWLKLGEDAIILTADLLQHAKDKPLPHLPIQGASQPMDDPMSADSAKKKINAAKG